MKLYRPTSIGYLRKTEYNLYQLCYMFDDEQAYKCFLNGYIISNIQRNTIFNTLRFTDHWISRKTYSKITGYKLE